MKKNVLVMFYAACLLVTAGCGYSTRSLLPPGYDSIHVDNFSNEIFPSREVSDKRSSFHYTPGLETDITRTIIDKFVFDGTLSVESSKIASLRLEGELRDFRQFPLSYDGDDNVEEFRIEILVDISLYDNSKDELLWREDSFEGESEYAVTGPNAKTEAAGLQSAVDDLAQRIVERTIEFW